MGADTRGFRRKRRPWVTWTSSRNSGALQLKQRSIVGLLSARSPMAFLTHSGIQARGGYIARSGLATSARSFRMRFVDSFRVRIVDINAIRRRLPVPGPLPVT